MIVSHKRTKIIATIGPASSSLNTMLELIKAGVGSMMAAHFLLFKLHDHLL